MKKLSSIVFILSLPYFTFSQNLVPNPSFEKVNEIVPNWSGTFSKFNRWMKTWNSPTQGSPDILFLKTKDKMFPKRPKVDLTNHFPRTGKFMLGLKTFGCESHTLHCKEYLQVRLKQPLIKGEEYYIEYWVSPIKPSVKVNSFGLYLTMEEVKELFVVGPLDVYPVFKSEDIVDGDSIQWHRISHVFTADDDYPYIIIGNFSTDKALDSKMEKDGLDYGYYLIDDVLLKPLNYELPVTFEPNETITLKNILFEYDKASIQASSHAQLNELVEYLASNLTNKIQIMGHTDALGNWSYNLKLSQKRAEEIKNYLVQHGIEAERIVPLGFGSKYPLVENDTEENRKLNRRVEIKILEE